MSIDQSIQWFLDRKGKVTYSMASRNGPSSYDCSSSVYYALTQGGLLPSMRIGNTDSLFGDLERNGWTKVGAPYQRGDVFIWGRRGASGGASGHTGQFVNGADVIHCAYGYNGIAVTNHDWLWRLNGSPELTVYRYVGNTAPANNPSDQIVEVGSFIKFDKSFRTDDVQIYGGIWQIRTNELCKVNFTWEDNGVPAEPVVEVDSDGYATPDQSLDVGSLYRIPGKYRVFDVGFTDGMWLALIEWNGVKFWVDLEQTTEIPESDGGTPAPGQRPAPTPAVTPTPEPEPVPVEPVKEQPVENHIVEVTEMVNEPTNTPKEEKEMAFTKEQQQELKVATESIQDVADGVANSEVVQDLVSGVSKRTKLIVYFVGDALIGLGLIVPSLAVVLDWTDVNRIVALSSLLATAGAFLLTMFSIYKSKK